MLKRKLKFYERVALILAIYMLVETLAFPLSLYALTSGPKQPEFTSFTPVATTNMVNTFTGGFNYNLPVLNIPGPDGGGYALSLSYNSEPNPEEQASWVGLGWNINPGALQRNKRGFADDANGIEVVKHNKTIPNWTVNTGLDANMEWVSMDDSQKNKNGQTRRRRGSDYVSQVMSPSLGFSYSKRANSSKGFMRTYGLNTSIYGLSLGMNINDGGGDLFSQY